MKNILFFCLLTEAEGQIVSKVGVRPQSDLEWGLGNVSGLSSLCGSWKCGRVQFDEDLAEVGEYLKLSISCLSFLFQGKSWVRVK